MVWCDGVVFCVVFFVGFFFFSLALVNFIQKAVFQSFLSAVKRYLSLEPRASHTETLEDGFKTKVELLIMCLFICGIL